MLMRARVPERTEHHIDERKVTVIKGVYTFGVVQGMPFGALYYVSQPHRCFYIAVLEYREKGHGKRSQRGSLRGEPGYDNKRQAGHEGKAYHVGNVEVKGPIGIKPLCAVVHLVEYLPQPVAAVQCFVPEVERKLIREYSRSRSPVGAQEREVQQLETTQCLVPEHGQVGGYHKIYHKRQQAFNFPVLNVRQLSGGQERFPQHECTIDTQ